MSLFHICLPDVVTVVFGRDRIAHTTLVSSSVIGMTTASLLSRSHDITIVARDLPGDEPCIDWASPWAGANFIAGGCTDPREKKMQLDAFAELWRLSVSTPESGLKQITIEDILDTVPADQIWWKDYVPEVTRPLVHKFLLTNSEISSVS